MPDIGTDEQAWQSKASTETLLKRALMMKRIRAFFDARDVVEVETPLLSRYATTDPHLDSLSTRFREQDSYLNTSPEYAMKRLLAQWQQSIYQICKAFRDDELGSHHNPEFTMLEWYRPGYDMMQLMDEVSELIRSLFVQAEIDLSFEYLSYQQAFENVTGLDPHHISAQQCFQYAIDNAVEIPLGLTAEDDVNDWLDWLLTQLILPSFRSDNFTFLYDYPATQCALAKLGEGGNKTSVAKRFELFYGEIELANGFDELTEGNEQLRRFRRENELRKRAGKQVISIDKHFIDALGSGLPACSGVAIGLDRVLMVLTGSQRIDQVLSFAWDRA